jgi:response regulator of citrate/malate metabolism
MLRVLVVEDEPEVAAAHGAYVGRIPGFDLAGIAHTGQEALRAVAGGEVDVVLLDMNLPDMHGLDIVRTMRANDDSTDVIAVTSARDLDVVRRSVSLGITQYLLKPFVFSTLQERLQRCAAFREELAERPVVSNQQAVDRLLSQPHPAATANTLPKGMSRESLERFTALLQKQRSAMSAAEAAERTGSARVTARRYLEYLCEIGLAVRRPRYASTGRPVVEYSWKERRSPG